MENSYNSGTFSRHTNELIVSTKGNNIQINGLRDAIAYGFSQGLIFSKYRRTHNIEVYAIRLAELLKELNYNKLATECYKHALYYCWEKEAYKFDRTKQLTKHWFSDRWIWDLQTPEYDKKIEKSMPKLTFKEIYDMAILHVVKTEHPKTLHRLQRFVKQLDDYAASQLELHDLETDHDKLFDLSHRIDKIFDVIKKRSCFS